jgi:predicted dithiol-disulfide oxidoreductase (DUF899 family)
VDRAADGGGGVPSSATIASAMTAATAAALALTIGLAAAVSGVVAVREMNGMHFRRRCRERFGSGFGRGLCCVGSSIGLMLILVAVSLMSVSWMFLIAALIATQRLLPTKAAIDGLLALAIIGVGVPIVIAPWSVPGLSHRYERRGPAEVAVTRIRRQTMTDHKTATRKEWLAARADLLTREKELTRMSDELAQQRQELPWVLVEKEYTLQAADGPKTLAQLFDGRSQLVVYHFMFGPDYAAGCPTCSSIADAVDGIVPHLNARDVTMLFVSQAPIEKLQTYQRRMGWSFPWVSSANSDFNADLGFSSSEEETREWVEPNLESLPPIADRNARESGTDLVGYLTQNFGFSTFARDNGTVYQTYSTGGRGVEFLMGYYAILDRVPKGRDEGDAFQVWIRRHNEYESE